MKIRRKIEQIIEIPEQIDLEDIGINQEDYTLRIINSEGRLGLEFYNQETGFLDYRINITDRGISFERITPEGKIESLQKPRGEEKHNTQWKERFPYIGECWDFYNISFGRKK